MEKMYPIYYNKKYMIEGVREWLIHGAWNEENINRDIDRSIKINQAEEPQEIVKESLLPEVEDEVIKDGFPIVLQMAYSGDLSIEQYINLMKNFISARELAYDLPECIDYDKLNNGVDICLKRMCESDIKDTRARSMIVNQNKLLESEQEISFFEEKKITKIIEESEITKEWNQRFQNLNNKKKEFLILKVARSTLRSDPCAQQRALH